MDEGRLEEARTDVETCKVCGACVKVCAWEARQVAGKRLVFDAEKCYGCSACEYVCPNDAVSMAPREEPRLNRKSKIENRKSKIKKGAPL